MTLVTSKKGKIHAIVKDVPKDDDSLDKPSSSSLLYFWNGVIDLAKDPNTHSYLPRLK